MPEVKDLIVCRPLKVCAEVYVKTFIKWNDRSSSVTTPSLANSPNAGNTKGRVAVGVVSSCSCIG